MASKRIGLALLALCVAAGLGYVYVSDRNAAGDSLKIYGSVDMRTVDLAFEESGRIGQVLEEEGDTVKTGDVLAKLDDERYAIALDNARATLEVRQKELDLLLAGSRDEEIDAARATKKATAASAALAQRICKRERMLVQASSEHLVVQACSHARVSQAQVRHVKVVGKQFHILREVGKQDIFVEVFQLPLRIARQPILDNFLFCFHKSLPLMVYFHRIKEQI